MSKNKYQVKPSKYICMVKLYGNQSVFFVEMKLTQFWGLLRKNWVRKTPWRRDRLPTPVFSGFPCDSAGKESACSVGDRGSIPGLGRSPGEGKGYPLQYPGLENYMDYIVHGVAESDWLSLSLSRKNKLLETQCP